MTCCLISVPAKSQAMAQAEALQAISRFSLLCTRTCR